MQIQNPTKSYKTTDYGQHSCQYHIVFCTKYNRRLFINDYVDVLKTILEQSAEKCEIEIIELMVMPDYVHMIVDCSPEFSVQKTINKFKQLTAGQLFETCPELKSRMPQIWTRKSFISTIGDITNNSICDYIEKQKERRIDD